MNYFFAAIFSFILAFFLVLLALKFFPKLKLMDRPERYGLKRKPIPYYGGLTIIIAFYVSVLLFVPLDSRVISLLISGGLIGIVSFFDDLIGLSPFFRLFIQILAAIILVVGGVGIKSVANPLGPTLVLDHFQFVVQLGNYSVTISLLAAIFTIIWIVTLMNTMNFLDGLNGLPSGVTVIAATILFVLSIRPHFHAVDQTTFATLAIILASVTFAFLLFDFYPAKILMGDTGSMFLGFLLATLAIFSGGKVATAFLVMGLPILDAFWVILRRIASKTSPMSGDLKHLHHRLLEMGFSNRQALYFIYSLCAFFGLIAIFLESAQKLWAMIFLFLIMFVVAIWAVKAGKAKKTDS